VVQRKEWLLVDGLAPFEVGLLYLIVVLRQHVVDLGIQVLLVEKRVRLRRILQFKQFIAVHTFIVVDVLVF
jgi:hypothetical protein